MHCSRCGEWTFAFRWCSWYQPSAEDLAGLRDWVRDREDPNLGWFRRCTPTCRANTLLVQLHEVEARLELELPRAGRGLRVLLRRLREIVQAAHEELDRAWIDLDR